MPLDQPPEGFISAAEACRILAVSDRTLRRRVAAGTIEGEYIARPQGSILYVKLPTRGPIIYSGGTVPIPHTADTAPEAAVRREFYGDSTVASGGIQAAFDTALAAPDAAGPSDAATRSLDIFREIFRSTNAVLEQERAERLRLAAENANLRERVGVSESRFTSERHRTDELESRLLETQVKLDAERKKSWWDKLRGR